LLTSVTVFRHRKARQTGFEPVTQTKKNEGQPFGHPSLW